MMPNDIAAKLKGFTKEERELTLTILQQIAKNGQSPIFEDLKYNDFDEIPVDIQTFLDDDKYLAKGIWMYDEVSGQRYCTLFPYWRTVLCKLFPDNLTTAYNTLILTGAIGLGKTLIGVISMLYLLYRMLCLKDPYAYYGMMPADKISFSMLNITLEAAQGVAWDKAQQLIQGSEWFMSHGGLNASRTNPQWQPPKGIELIFGSSNRQVVGRALFSNLTDEVNFGIGSDVEKKKEKQKKMISQIDARMKSRFGKGTFLPTLNIIISSKDVEQAFLESYINTKKNNESKTTLIIDEPQWIVRNDKGTPDDPGSFYVAVGNKVLAHELLPIDADEKLVEWYRDKGHTMLKIPPIFRNDFEDNLDQALMDVAGLSTSNSLKYISGDRLRQAKTDTYKNPFTKDIIKVGNDPNDQLQYANFFDLSVIRPADFAKPLFIHLDMSLSGDKTGISGVVIDGRRAEQQSPQPLGLQDLAHDVLPPTISPEPDKEIKVSNDLCYKLLFSVSIEAPKGYQISFEKNRNFIKWLRDKGFAIRGVSSDTYQSAQIQQDLKAEGFKTEIVSVDRVDSQSKMCLPYHYLKSSIYERRVTLYKKCDLLTEELIGLERLSSGKIDHTASGVNSKDQADAFCGALYLASKFSEEYSYDYGDNLSTSLDISLEGGSDEDKKQQMLKDFETELAKLYEEQEVINTEEQEKRQKAYQQQKDILDGIIII